MTKEEIKSLTKEQQVILDKLWLKHWKKIQPKDGYTTLYLREQQEKFLKEQSKP
jgi:hypothetical protein